MASPQQFGLTLRCAALAVALVAGCGGGPSTASDGGLDGQTDAGVQGAIRINELMSKNEGAWVDEVGETDDWVELLNLTDEQVLLSQYALADSNSGPIALPGVLVGPGETIVFWADDTPEQGPLHLPFKLSSGGDTLSLLHAVDGEVDHVRLPALEPNVSWQRVSNVFDDFVACRYATPDAPNGESCGPPPPPELPAEIEFEPFSLPEIWPPPQSQLLINEVALRPASFIEVINIGELAVPLSSVALRIATHAPGEPWPDLNDGVLLAWPQATLASGARAVVQVDAADVAALQSDPNFEGVLTLFEVSSGDALERIDFMHWPVGAALTRFPDVGGRHVFCAQTSPGFANLDCDPLASREVGDRLRHLRTPGDFAALAAGGTTQGAAAVKFLYDLQAGGVTHLLSSRVWDLHYTFVREEIEHLAPLDRCDPTENAIFRSGWGQYSVTEYFQVEGRRFLAGTLVKYAGAGLRTLEFAAGDRISGPQMREAFFGVARNLIEPRAWAIRPQANDQVAQALLVDGTLPLVDPNAPFRGLTYQPLTQTVGYGFLRFVPVAELDDAALGPQVIVVTDDVPNDIQLVGGLITEAFQTPLAHVNVLSRNRDTPNMALRNARSAQPIASLLDKLVRLEVGSDEFVIREATTQEAEAFWESRRPTGPRQVPRLDTSVRALVDLSAIDQDALPYVGGKAAQLAELGRVVSFVCGAAPVPAAGFAIPAVHSLEHFAASGARDLLTTLQADVDFRNDPQTRATGLAQVRQRIVDHPVDPTLLSSVTSQVAARFAGGRVRFRSSSNTEDLPSFNGAGLYESTGIDGADPDDVSAAIKQVWASLWLQRAYDEREFANIDQDAVAMSVLVHPGFPSERANGVAVSRNLLNPIRGDQYYVNAQVGEALVTNPAPGVVTEQLTYWPGGNPRVAYQSRSSLARGNDVVSRTELDRLSCFLTEVHRHFRPILDPLGENPWFAMEIEFKYLGPQRSLLIKQARPYSFGGVDIPQDCREF